MRVNPDGSVTIGGEVQYGEANRDRVTMNHVGAVSSNAPEVWDGTQVQESYADAALRLIASEAKRLADTAREQCGVLPSQYGQPPVAENIERIASQIELRAEVDAIAAKMAQYPYGPTCDDRMKIALCRCILLLCDKVDAIPIDE